MDQEWGNALQVRELGGGLLSEGFEGGKRKRSSAEVGGSSGTGLEGSTAVAGVQHSAIAADGDRSKRMRQETDGEERGASKGPEGSDKGRAEGAGREGPGRGVERGDEAPLPRAGGVPQGADGKPLEIIPGQGEQISQHPSVVKQTVGQPHESVRAAAEAVRAAEAGEKAPPTGLQLDNLSQGQQVPQAGAGAQNGDKGSVPGAEAAPVRGPSSREVYRIPTHAGWFSWNAIHTIEKRSLPEFFNGKLPSKTPKIYKDYRDAIISKYRENPGRLLTFTEVRRILVGDVNAIRRVFEFLDHWGLINYHASPSSALQPPKWAGVPATLVESEPAGVRVVSPAITPANSLFRFDPPRAPLGVAGPAVPGGEGGAHLLSSLATRQNAYGPAAAEAAVAAAAAAMAGPAVEFHCNSCAADCSKRRYHCQKQADFDVCPSCFADGKFGPGMTSADFIRMDAPEEGGAPADSDEWSDQETLLLLEALELYGDNWSEIAEHVATKTRAQCILHFIRLPIEDPFLEDMEGRGAGKAAPATAAEGAEPPPPTGVPAGGGTAEGGTSEGAAKRDANGVGGEQAGGSAEAPGKEGGRGTGEGKEAPGAASEKTGAKAAGKEGAEDVELTPFADAGNPVMAQVAFLAAMVGPRVAAAAAQAALAALTEEDPAARSLVASGLAFEDPPPLGTQPPRAPQGTEQLSGGVPPGTAAPSANGILPSEGTHSVAKAEPGDVNGGQKALEAVDDSRAHGTERAVKAEAPGLVGEAKGEEGVPAVRVRAAAATALAAAAVKAKLLADQEEREIQRLVASVIENQLKKLEIKLHHFDDLEEMLSKEKEQIERQRQQLYAERVRLAASRVPQPAPPPQPKTNDGPGGSATQLPPSTTPPASSTLGPPRVKPPSDQGTPTVSVFGATTSPAGRGGTGVSGAAVSQG